MAIFWHRRDLRLSDNAGLYHALKSGLPVLSLFIFDREILDELEDKDDARVTFIHQEIAGMKEELEEMGSSMLVGYGSPEQVWKKLLKNSSIAAVYTNRDYEPYAKERDKKIKKLLEDNDIAFHTYKDHVVFEGDEVLKDDGDPYVVFTPYSKKWKAHLKDKMEKIEGEEISYYLKAYPNEKYQAAYLPCEPFPLPELKEMGFEKNKEIAYPPKTVPRKTIKQYKEKRNFPAQEGTSRLSIHFRFGTISIREKALRAKGLSETYLNELIWRDFYSQILDHFPKVVDTSFREKYDNIKWRNNEDEFEAWCAGKTGYPIVDAGMRELNNSGYMHNRVRMIVASFLTKHLLIDWRWGEAYFARKLLDYDLASNNGGWQWAAGSGTDAAPYFRIFNPYTQREKFDKDWKYVKEWIPEYGTEDYPEEIVEHKEARKRCLERYKEGLD